MGIGFEFALRPRRKLFGKRDLNRQMLEQKADEIAMDQAYHCKKYQNRICCELCVEGNLCLEIQEDMVKGECQTNVAGPGFHKAAIEFLERLAYELKWSLEIQDDTDYYLHRDFNRMRQEHFYRWLSELIQLIVDQEEQSEGSRYLCWPLGYYLPDGGDDRSVVTPVRRFSYRELRGLLNSGMFMGFAKEFFVWNEPKREASFYRNSALVRMNKECYFMPSVRSEEDKEINELIRRNLEMCLSMDPTLPFPVKEYLLICELEGVDPQPLEGISQLVGDYDLGYRRGLVYREFGSIRFAVPGSYLMDSSSENKTVLFYDGLEEGWHNYRITGYETEGDAVFMESMFSEEGVAEVQEFTADRARVKAAIYDRDHEDGRYGMVGAQIIYRNQLTLIIICFEGEETKWALGLLKKIHTIASCEEDEG